jgi:hypothetical protein
MQKISMTLAVITALSASTAFAVDGNSRLQVTMDRPVGLMVDGRMQEVEDQSMTYMVEGLQPGRHEVSLRAMFGKELANVFVDIPEAAELRCRYRKKHFECYDTIALAPVAAPILAAPVTAIAPAPSTHTVETTTVTTGAMMPAHSAPTGIGGAIAIAGPDGEHVSIGVNISGPGAAMGGQFTETTTTTTTHSAPQFAEAQMAPAVPGKVSLVLRSTDGEWADVVVDGKVVAEFRNEDEIKVDIASGTHTLEVREFMKDSAYTRAKIDTGYATEIIVGLNEGSDIECFNHDGCYDI